MMGAQPVRELGASYENSQLKVNRQPKVKYSDHF
jgi:hypothetical protein